MMQSIHAEYFDIRELVPESVFDARGQKAWQLIDLSLIENADSLRKQLNVSMTCNNWHSGGARTQSGLRIPGQSHYKPYSQHSFGRALDLICSVSAKEIRQDLKDKVIVLPYPATFEEGGNITWLHMDVRNQDEHTYFFRV